MAAALNEESVNALSALRSIGEAAPSGNQQAALDGNWETTWKLLGLGPPPWADWAGQGAGVTKREYANSRLAAARWGAAVVADMEDEDFLMKRRSAPKGGGKGDKRAPAEGQESKTTRPPSRRIPAPPRPGSCWCTNWGGRCWGQLRPWAATCRARGVKD